LSVSVLRPITRRAEKFVKADQRIVDGRTQDGTCVRDIEVRKTDRGSKDERRKSVTVKASQSGSLGRSQKDEAANGRKTDTCTYGVGTRFQGRWQVVIEYADLVGDSFTYAHSLFSERLSEN